MIKDGVICICSRGLLHSRMIESVDREVEESGLATWPREYSHDLPIPDAQNDVTARALKHELPYLWFVEEDIVVPKGTLQKLLDADADIAVATYKLPGGLMSHKLFKQKGTLVFGGLGCTLIHSRVFKKLEEPYFRTDRGYSVGSDDSISKSRYEWPYGGQDVQFFIRALEAGLKRQFVDIECDHLYVEEYGEPRTNNGCHVIKQH